MVVRIECPRTGEVATIQSATWEEIAGQEIRCPVCKEVHPAILAPESPPTPEPMEEVSPPEGMKPIFPIGGVVLATFLGSSLAGGIVFALNYRRLGRPSAAIASIVLGVLGAVAAFVLAFALPESTPGVVIWMPFLLVAWIAAKLAFEKPLGERSTLGVQPAGVGIPAAVGGVCLVLLLAGLGAWILLDDFFPGELLEIGDDEVYYSAGATEADARKLHEVLTDVGFLGNPGGATIHLEKLDRGYAIDVVLVDGAWDDAELLAEFLEIGQSVANAGFKRPIALRLCDDTAERHRTLTVE